jgi:hypothetical protein
MATNLCIDPDLIERALEVSGERTKKAAVTKALQEFIARRQQKLLLDLMGKLDWNARRSGVQARGGRCGTLIADIGKLPAFRTTVRDRPSSGTSVPAPPMGAWMHSISPDGAASEPFVPSRIP